MPPVWSAELWRLLGFVLVALGVGVIVRHVFLAVSVALVAYLGWHLYNIFRLEQWLRRGAPGEPPDGAGVWAEIYTQFYRFQQGHRRRKRRLAEFVGRFRELTAAMPDAIVVLGPEAEMEWFNEAAGRLLGLHSRHDIGQRIVNLVRHPNFTELLGGENYGVTVEFPGPVDGRLTLAANVIPYGRDQRLLIVRDVTRVRRLEEIRSDFVANVSHELRTPLTVIGGFVETMINTDDACTKKWARPLELMNQHTTRMQSIVSDLLLLSRLETEKKLAAQAPVAVPATLAAIRDDAQALSGENAHKISLQADQNLWLEGNEMELRSAFSNLVFNAVQYTPAGGEVTLRWYEDATGVHFAVSDTGPGISAQYLPRLTERFYRVDVGRSRESGGTGLGLAIVKHVLERHEGTLAIESKVGVGSVFRCDFPAHLIRRP